MLDLIIKKQKEKKYLWMNLGIFSMFMIVYTLIDSFNLSYASMVDQYGPYLPIVNILLNIIMAAISTVMITFTTAQFDFTGKESKASNLSFVSVLFGILTYGCTPCVIGFFAAIGITFSVVALPLAGLPYKFISLAILIGGLIWILIRLRKVQCKLPPKETT